MYDELFSIQMLLNVGWIMGRAKYFNYTQLCIQWSILVNDGGWWLCMALRGVELYAVYYSPPLFRHSLPLTASTNKVYKIDFKSRKKIESKHSGPILRGIRLLLLLNDGSLKSKQWEKNHMTRCWLIPNDGWKTGTALFAPKSKCFPATGCGCVWWLFTNQNSWSSLLLHRCWLPCLGVPSMAGDGSRRCRVVLLLRRDRRYIAWEIIAGWPSASTSKRWLGTAVWSYPFWGGWD